MNEMIRVHVHMRKRKGVVRLNQEDLHNQGFSYKNLINCVKLMK